MKLSEEKIKEFQKLYFNSFGVSLNKDEAIELGLVLCQMMQALTVSQLKNENEYAKTSRLQIRK